MDPTQLQQFLSVLQGLPEFSMVAEVLVEDQDKIPSSEKSWISEINALNKVIPPSLQHHPTAIQDHSIVDSWTQQIIDLNPSIKSTNISSGDIVTSTQENFNNEEQAFVTSTDATFDEVAFTTSAQYEDIQQLQLEDHKPYYADSGCSKHMVCDKEAFKEMRVLPVPVRIRCGGNNILLATHVGTVLLPLLVYGHKLNIPLQDVLYVPELGVNLVSVRTCVAKQMKVTFFKVSPHTPAVCEILLPNGTCICTATEIGSQFVLNMQCELNTDDAFVSQIVKEIDEDTSAPLIGRHVSISKAALLHRRLNHASVTKLKEMGFNVVSFGTCEPCILAKSTRHPTKMPAIKSNNLFEIIRSDLGGPIHPPGMRAGERYYALFQDDASRYLATTTLVAKSELPEKFAQLYDILNKQGHRISILFSDQGGEYKSKKMEKICAERGVVQQFSSAGCPDQNGLIERANRTVMEACRAMLFTSGAPAQCWIWALEALVMVHNYLPHSALAGISPHQKVYQTTPPHMHLRTWGCSALVLTTTGSVRKLDPRARKFVFIGYVPGALDKSYRFLDPETLNVSTHRDVEFLEDDFSACDQLRKRLGLPIKETAMSASMLDIPYEDYNIVKGKTSPPLHKSEELKILLSPVIKSEELKTSHFSLSQFSCSLRRAIV